MAEDIKSLLSRETRVAPRRSLAEEAADALRDLILLEKLAPGTAVPERDLAEGLGISRTPLREAMRILEREGLIEYSETRRPRVADPSLDELADNLGVLGALEAYAGKLATLRASDAEIERVAGLARTMRETSDTAPPLEFFRCDMDFHTTIVTAARNAPLLDTHRQYNARLWRARFISSRMRPSRDNTLAQHDAIVAALRARDADAAATAMETHLKTTVTNIAKSLAMREGEGRDE
jgi:DNA-binding GntR family transcriptional regulator